MAKFQRAFSSPTLDTLFTSFHAGQCADVRDRIYALLGLIKDDVARRSLSANYTITPTKLYYQVLAHVRYSPSLATKSAWKTFRDHLKTALQVADDETFRLCDLVYEVTEEDRPMQKPLWSLLDDARKRLTKLVVERLDVYFGESHYEVDGTAERTYSALVEKFKGFPREDDPEAWRCFDDLVREALGLPLLHSKMEEIFDTYIEIGSLD
jgi:hypothetical protein